MSYRAGPSYTLPSASQLDTDAKTHHRVRGSMGKSHFAIDPSAMASSSVSVSAQPPLAPPRVSLPSTTRGRSRTSKRLLHRDLSVQPSSSVSHNRSVARLDKSGSSTSNDDDNGGGGVEVEAVFENVPRNNSFDKLLPILSRLPASSVVKEDIDEAALVQATLHGGKEDDALDYLPGRLVPYTRSRLPSIDAASLVLWRALHHFRPLTADYAVGYLDPHSRTKETKTPPHPLPEGVEQGEGDTSLCPAFTHSHSPSSTGAISTIRRVFNWSTLPPLPLEMEAEWYGVIFRSARRKGSESLNFYEADRLAHEEAVRSGGLLLYWYGSPDMRTGENLATCIWTSRDEAIEASRLPRHGEAARFTREAYRSYELTRYSVRKVGGERGLRIEEWEERG